MSETYEQMLAETYDAQYAGIRDPIGDAAFYAELADEVGGPVLELGCGTGRVLLPTAEAGHDIVGVDPSPWMLRILREKNPPEHVTLVQATAQTLDLAQRDFGLATFPFRAFMHLESPDEQLEALRHVHAHLRPGGWLALDVFEPNLERMAVLEEDGQQDPFAWRGRNVLRKFAVVRDPTRQTQRVRFDYSDVDTGEALGTEEIAMRWTYRYELEHLLWRAGFEPFRWSSGYDGRPYEAQGDIVVVARKA